MPASMAAPANPWSAKTRSGWPPRAAAPSARASACGACPRRPCTRRRRRSTGSRAGVRRGPSANPSSGSRSFAPFAPGAPRWPGTAAGARPDGPVASSTRAVRRRPRASRCPAASQASRTRSGIDRPSGRRGRAGPDRTRPRRPSGARTSFERGPSGGPPESPVRPNCDGGSPSTSCWIFHRTFRRSCEVTSPATQPSTSAAASSARAYPPRLPAPAGPGQVRLRRRARLWFPSHVGVTSRPMLEEDRG